MVITNRLVDWCWQQIEKAIVGLNGARPAIHGIYVVYDKIVISQEIIDDWQPFIDMANAHIIRELNKAGIDIDRGFDD